MANDINKIKVWDGFVRLFHWSLVICVVANLLNEAGDAPHRYLSSHPGGLLHRLGIDRQQACTLQRLGSVATHTLALSAEFAPWRALAQTRPQSGGGSDDAGADAGGTRIGG